MTAFRNFPIRRKLTIAVLGTTLVVLLAASGAFLAYERSTYIRLMESNLQVLADALALNSTVAISFNAPGEATDILEALSVKSSVEAASLYDAAGVLFAKYTRGTEQQPVPPRAEPDGTRSVADHLVVVRPVMLDDRRLGTLYLRSDLTELSAHLRAYVQISGLVLLGSLVLASLLSSALQRAITRPILALTETAENIAATRDYQARAKKRSADEIGKLTDSFNQMLSTIQERDAALQSGNEALRAENADRKRAVQLLAWEKGALEIISSRASLHEALDEVMLGLEEQSPGVLCSVLLLDADGVHLRHGAAPSLPEAYNRLVDGITIGPAVGSCGTAAFENRQVIVTDIASDPLWADFRELACEHGLRACWSTPIHGSEQKILGTFAVYTREPRAPAPAEMDLITRAVHVTRIAIERKQAEAEIRQLNASLEQRVRDRTGQLEAAVKELDAFSYSVSHDLRAPLRAVDGFTRMLAEDYSERLDDEGRRMLGVIRSETQRMGRLIDDLLAFSRLSRQQMESTRVDMRALAQEVFDELAMLDPGRKLQLNLQPLPPVRGTQAMLRQVWANLIGNAIKFTKERAIGEIEIGARPGEDGAQVYYVRDNGAGFDMRHAGKLFGVFQRLHSQQEFSGTGVGLALVQRIVQRHGGSIWAEAEIDHGATFSFALPK